MSNFLVDVVDENDDIIGRAFIDEAQVRGLCHRIARISLEDPEGKILLQQRQADKELFPGSWDNSVSGHVDCGEEYFVEAERELYEELGVVTQLEEIRYYETSGEYRGKLLNRFTRLYRSVVSAEATLRLQTDEVADVRWVSRAELSDLVCNQPDKIADGLRDVFEILYA